MTAPSAFKEWWSEHYGHVADESEADAVYFKAVGFKDELDKMLESAIASLADEEAENERLESRVRELEAALEAQEKATLEAESAIRDGRSVDAAMLLYDQATILRRAALTKERT